MTSDGDVIPRKTSRDAIVRKSSRAAVHAVGSGEELNKSEERGIRGDVNRGVVVQVSHLDLVILVQKSHTCGDTKK